MHDWNVETERAREIQQGLRGRVAREPLEGEVRTVAGADISFERGSDELFAAVVVLDARTLETTEVASVHAEATFPYVPGLLSFREAPAVLEALDRLSESPDLLICDGHGYAHPRRFGLACHLGVWLDLPTIGSAKSVLVGKHDEPRPQKGAYRPLEHEGERVGRALRTRDEVNPIYVSVGHRVTLDAATAQILRVSPTYKIPEPIRAAHRRVNHLRKGQ
ncbi:MAG: deoxyribonuclease V [Bradymonadaceae bacterium]